MSRKVTPQQRRVRMSRLDVRQQKFVAELLADEHFNISRAAKAAGYKSQKAASNLLNNPLVARAVGNALQDRLDRLKITADEVMEQLTNILRLDPLDVFQYENGMITVRDLNEVPKHLRICIKRIEPKNRTTYDRDGNVLSEESIVKIEFMDKDAALALCMKHFGLITEGKVPVNVAAAGAENLLENLLKDVESRSNIIDAKVIENRVQETSTDLRPALPAPIDVETTPIPIRPLPRKKGT